MVAFTYQVYAELLFCAYNSLSALCYGTFHTSKEISTLEESCLCRLGSTFRENGDTSHVLACSFGDVHYLYVYLSSV